MNGNTAYTELDQREGDGVTVSLLWRRHDNRLKVSVTDTATGEEFELDAHPENALDVFHHPFAYAAFYRLDCGFEAAAPLSTVETNTA
jgi:hypothetical protein